MKIFLLLILNLLIVTSCQSGKSEWHLIKNFDQVSKHEPFGYKSGYINQIGDTVIPLDKYVRCFTDTAIYYAIVYDKKQGLIGIDLNEKKLFNAVWDGEGSVIKESEGMILIEENGKFGFANYKGKTIIEPRFEYAESFRNGKARVSKGNITRNNALEKLEINNWYFIDKNGNEIIEN
ncbi:hypothetical protein BST97_05940 [Nonlabens spongiae]|uniref:WG repeat-containing protein n=1 Tax=Nonlabens spongiae TaxID=331648 RepID=A0A1W6MJ92_9FLAO|nr:WG repeat-containing protein [Nonlabens spongiae]ARN77566.1 hypothetical protein BST97_05940 [Nonlabens spongiae]